MEVVKIEHLPTTETFVEGDGVLGVEVENLNGETETVETTIGEGEEMEGGEGEHEGIVEGEGVEVSENGGEAHEEVAMNEETEVVEEVPSSNDHEMNGQLEIEIPAGESREGTIHTIQLQSPGGNTHIVEGLVVTSAGSVGGGDEGETAAIFHPATSSAFILPTVHHTHHNNLTPTTAAIVTSTSSSPQTCEVITADNSEHNILSGLQVVRVTSGESGETIFLVPSSATGGDDKDGMQQVMVLQSTTEEISDGSVHVQQEVVEESVELNIPSPKPVLTSVSVKQEGGRGGEVNDSESMAVVDTLEQEYQQQGAATTTAVVVVKGGSNKTQAVSTTANDTKPIVTVTPAGNTKGAKGAAAAAKATNANTKAPGTPSRSPRAPTILNGPSIADDRPKRKAALKAVATRKAALASSSPRKHSTTPRANKPKGKAAAAAAATAAKAPPPPTPSTSATTPKATKVKVEPISPPKAITQVQSVAKAQPSLGLIGNTARALFSFSPPAPVLTTPSYKVIPTPVGPSCSSSSVAQGNAVNNKNYFLLPEDLVSDSDDEGGGIRPRKCVVCLRKKRFTEDIFETPDTSNGGPAPRHHARVLPHMDVLITHLNISVRGKPHEVGICLNCLDSLQRWHVFNCAVVKRHENAKGPQANLEGNPFTLETFETRIYRNFKKMGKVKEVYKSATHSHFARRNMTEKDWDYFCEHLFRSSSARSEKGRALEKYMTCREKLSQIYCVKCQRLVRNGKKGFVKHMKTHHPHQQILFPCDICGSHYPEKGFGSSEDYYPHWISHFYFNTCDECGKKFPTKRSLGQHRQSVHKNRTWPKRDDGEDRPFKCDQCDATFKLKTALVSHRDVVHLNLKNHVCNICGEAFKSASSLRGHVRRHEGRRDYKCEVCNKEYYTYSALKGHKVVHQTARDFICGICNKAFKKKKALEEHGTLHTGVKPHRCPICGREIRVKSNLYKHMKIHKKNAELGITSGRGRSLANRNSTANNNSGSSSQQQHQPQHQQQQTKTPPNKLQSAAPKWNQGGVGEPKVKQIKVEDRILEIKQEPQPIIAHFQAQPSSIGVSGSVSALNHNAPLLATSSSPMQGATAVDVVLENATIGNGEHRVPMVVSIVTDDPNSILSMNPEQQAQILNAVTSFATSQGHNVTVAASALGGAGGPTFLASHLPSSSTNGTQSVVSPATSAISVSGQDPILGVSTTQFYNTQQFFTSLDQLQN